MTNVCSSSNVGRALTKAGFLVVWISTNILLFHYVFSGYYHGVQYYYLRQMLGFGLCLSRATATCINYNAALLLLPMCRKMTGYALKLLHLPDRCQTMSLYRWIHAYCAYMLCIMAAVHSVAHLFNAMNFCEHFDPVLMEINLAKLPNQKAWIVMMSTWPGISGVLLLITLIVIISFATKILRKANYDRFLKTHHLFIIFYILLLLHSLNGVIKYQTNVSDHKPGCYVSWGGNMTSMKMKKINSSRASQDLQPTSAESLPEKENMQQHQKKSMKMNANWGHQMRAFNSSECSENNPKFESCKSHTWRWLCVPMLLYLVERIHRLCMASYYSAHITDVIHHSGDVMQIKLKLNGFRVKPGQSVGVRCPAISRVEMHPFSVTSADDNGNFNCEIFIKCCGDWTNDLQSILQETDDAHDENVFTIVPEAEVDQQRNNRLDMNAEDINKLLPSDHRHRDSKDSINSMSNFSRASSSTKTTSMIDARKVPFPPVIVEGPFTSCLQSVMNYNTAICVAGGIGVTPFISIINHLLSLKKGLTSLKMKRLELVWSCRDPNDILWFADVIRRLCRKVLVEEIPDFFTVTIHVTGRNIEKQSPTLIFDWELLEGIPIHRKRPDIKRKFQQFDLTNPRSKVGVFCCGPKGLVSSVRHLCEESYQNSTVFKYHKESFS